MTASCLEETLTDAYSQISIAKNQLLGERCSRFVLELSVPSEGEETYAALERIRGVAASSRSSCPSFS